MKSILHLNIKFSNCKLCLSHASSFPWSSYKIQWSKWSSRKLWFYKGALCHVPLLYYAWTLCCLMPWTFITLCPCTRSPCVLCPVALCHILLIMLCPVDCHFTPCTRGTLFPVICIQATAQSVCSQFPHLYFLYTDKEFVQYTIIH